MYKTTSFFIALFCLNTQATFNSEAQPRSHQRNPFTTIAQRTDLALEEKINTMRDLQKAMLTHFQRKHSSSDVLLLQMIENLDAQRNACLTELMAHPNEQ